MEKKNHIYVTLISHIFPLNSQSLIWVFSEMIQDFHMRWWSTRYMIIYPLNVQNQTYEYMSSSWLETEISRMIWFIVKHLLYLSVLLLWCPLSSPRWGGGEFLSCRESRDCFSVPLLPRSSSWSESCLCLLERSSVLRRCLSSSESLSCLCFSKLLYDPCLSRSFKELSPLCFSLLLSSFSFLADKDDRRSLNVALGFCSSKVLWLLGGPSYLSLSHLESLSLGPQPVFALRWNYTWRNISK